MKISVKFRLRPSQESDALVYCRLRIDGKVATDFSTGVRVAPAKWNQKEQRIRGASRDVQEDNQLLENVRADLKSIFNELGSMGKPRTAQIVRNQYLIKRSPSPGVSSGLAQFVEHLKLTQGLSKATSYKWSIVQEVLNEFIRAQRREDLEYEEFDADVATLLLEHFRTVRKWSNNYAAKMLPYLSKAWQWAMQKKKWVQVNPFAGLSVKRDGPKPIEYLEEDQLATLEKMLPVGTLARVRDCFLWQCYTGMAYNELRAFRASEHVREDVIRIQRGKTAKTNDFDCIVPLLPGIRLLLDAHGEKLPVLTNQDYNRQLKALALLIGYRKNLTTHIGRKTAGMYLLNRGVPLETVSRILGHASTKTTERHYARVLKSRVLRDTAHLMTA